MAVHTAEGKQILVDVFSRETIYSLKRRLEAEVWIPADDQIIVNSGQIMENTETVEQMARGGKVFVLRRLRDVRG